MDQRRVEEEQRRNSLSLTEQLKLRQAEHRQPVSQRGGGAGASRGASRASRPQTRKSLYEVGWDVANACDKGHKFLSENVQLKRT